MSASARRAIPGRLRETTAGAQRLHAASSRATEGIYKLGCESREAKSAEEDVTTAMARVLAGRRGVFDPPRLRRPARSRVGYKLRHALHRIGRREPTRRVLSRASLDRRIKRRPSRADEAQAGLTSPRGGYARSEPDPEEAPAVVAVDEIHDAHHLLGFTQGPIYVSYPPNRRRRDEAKSTGRQSQLPALPQGDHLPDGDGLALVAQREAPQLL